MISPFYKRSAEAICIMGQNAHLIQIVSRLTVRTREVAHDAVILAAGALAAVEAGQGPGRPQTRHRCSLKEQAGPYAAAQSIRGFADRCR